MAIKLLKVLILSPKQIIYEGEALAVSSKNSTGKFDILPQHANFITLVENQPITTTLQTGKRLVFKFPMAIIYNSDNVIKIYTDIII